jgi:mono/diheme cytochrome c family protein
MQGVKGTFETFKGRVEDGLDEATGEFALDLEPGQPVETDGPLTALFQDGTRVFERKGRPLDAGAIVAGARGHFDGRLVLSDSEPDLLRTALIVLELAPEGETVLRGDIASLEAGGFVLITSQGDRCVDIGDDTEVFLIVPEGDDGVRSERGEIADLADGQQVDVYGEEDTDGCLDAGTIVVDDTFEEVPPANQPPVASAGPDVTIDVGESVMLDGSGSSDPEGEPLIYAWTLEPPDGSTASLAGADTAMPSFTADVAGDYVAELTVDDGELTATDTAIVTASEATVNQAPVADAGPDQTVEVGTTVTLDGTGSSDPDGDALSYRWTLSVPDGSSAALDDASVATPTFTPDVAGVYNATLVVDDGELEAAADDVAITAEEATAGIDGVALWEDNCAACHGDIAAPSNWPIRFPTAEEIQAAIEAGTGGMGSTRLRALTAEEIRAIADAISAAGGGS